MSWSKYGEFLAFAVVLVLIPGPDFAVVTKHTLAGGRRRGRWTALGVSSSNLVQGTAAAAGLHLQHHQPEGAGLLPRRAAAVPHLRRRSRLAARNGLEPRGPQPGLPVRAGHRAARRA